MRIFGISSRRVGGRERMYRIFSSRRIGRRERIYGIFSSRRIGRLRICFVTIRRDLNCPNTLNSNIISRTGISIENKLLEVDIIGMNLNSIVRNLKLTKFPFFRHQRRLVRQTLQLYLQRMESSKLCENRWCH